MFYNRNVISVTKLACCAVWRMPSCGSSQYINTHWHAAHNNWDSHWLLFQGRVVYLVYWWNSDYLCDSLKRSAHITGWFGLSIWGLRSVIWRAQVKEIKFTFLVFFDLCTYGFDECMRVYFHLSWRVCLQAGYIQLGQVIWPKQMHKRCLFHTWKVLLLFNKTA